VFLTRDFVREFGGDATIRMHSPERRETVFRFDAPWEGVESGYASVVADGDGYRLHYRGGGELSREQACLALSNDGVRWTRPSLDLHEFQGSRDNNIMWMPERPSYDEAHNFFAFRDDGPGVAADSRWKAVALHIYPDESGERHKMLATLASPDGIHWRRLTDRPAISAGRGFDSLNIAFRDPFTQRYVCYSRTSRDGFRHIQRSISDDFRTWQPAELIQFPEEPRTQFYTNGIVPLPRPRPDDAGPWYVGMPMRFVPERKSVQGRATDGLSDAVLIAGRDGLLWHFVSREAWIRPGPDPANWGNAHGNNTPVHGILATGEHEWSVYWMERYGTGTPEIRRGVLRPEGFASLQAGAGGGTAVVGPVDLRGRRVLLNAATSAVGYIRVGVLDAAGRPVESKTVADCETLWGDGLFLPVRWRADEPLPGDSSLENAFLEVELADADVYAIRAVGP